MTDQRIEDIAAQWQPDMRRQRLADYTVEDLLRLPPDAPAVELVDGVIHVLPLPTPAHQDVSSLLCVRLRAQAPAHLAATQAARLGLAVNTVQRPDVILHRAEVGRSGSLLTPDDVILAAEVVSPGTRSTDRFAKPADYAAEGIRYYWRVEQDPVHVCAYRLADRAGRSGRREYELVADSPDLLELTEPFPIKLPIAEITP